MWQGIHILVKVTLVPFTSSKNYTDHSCYSISLLYPLKSKRVLDSLKSM